MFVIGFIALGGGRSSFGASHAQAPPKHFDKQSFVFPIEEPQDLPNSKNKLLNGPGLPTGHDYAFF